MCEAAMATVATEAEREPSVKSVSEASERSADPSADASVASADEPTAAYSIGYRCVGASALADASAAIASLHSIGSRSVYSRCIGS